MWIVSHARIYKSKPIYPQRWGYWHVINDKNINKTLCGINVITSHERKFDYALSEDIHASKNTCKSCQIRLGEINLKRDQVR